MGYPVLDDDALYFVPLGGAEQFGVNLNVYACDGDFLAIDCGIGFADERFPGIDLLLPDPAFLEANRERLKGMMITHAHEDHICAVAHLWERFACPIYTAPFTAAVLRKNGVILRTSSTSTLALYLFLASSNGRSMLSRSACPPDAMRAKTGSSCGMDSDV